MRGGGNGILVGGITTGGGGIAMKGNGLGVSREFSAVEPGTLWGVSSKIENLSNGLGQFLRKGATQVLYSSAL